MKEKRQKKILELIGKFNIDTQEELADRLRKEGFSVTQATVSRDIRELKLQKTQGLSGRQKYVPAATEEMLQYDKFVRVIRNAGVSVEQAMNLAVVKTAPGMAMAVAAALDSMEFPEIIGSIAGDDTIMCATKDTAEAANLIKKIRGIL